MNDTSVINPELLTTQSDAHGYKIFYRGVTVYAAGIKESYYEKKRKNRGNTALFREQALYERERILRGVASQFVMERIKMLDELKARKER